MEVRYAPHIPSFSQRWRTTLRLISPISPIEGDHFAQSYPSLIPGWCIPTMVPGYIPQVVYTHHGTGREAYTQGGVYLGVVYMPGIA